MKERIIHAAIVEWLGHALPPPKWCTTIPGGDGSRTQAPGYVRGAPDINLLVDGRSIYIEVKGPKGRVSPAQAEQHAAIVRAGGRVIVARSIEDVQRGLDEIGVPLRTRSVW